MTLTRSLDENNASSALPLTLTPLERALLRLLMTGYALEDAAPSVGLSLSEAGELLQTLQSRCGISGTTRLLAVAILRAWV
ncbi:MAG: hypothetical protein ACRYFS_18130 [Janthinobacterium lividum]